MDEKQKQALRDAGLSEDEISKLDAERTESSKTEAFLAELEVATVSEQKRIATQKAYYLTYKAACTDDKFESRAIDKVAYKLKRANRFAGGLVEM